MTAFVPVKKFDEEHFIVMASRQGTIKKTALSAFANPRRGGIAAMDLPEGDELIETGITDGTNEIILATQSGLAVRFHEDKVRAMGRTAYGVRGVALDPGDRVIGMVVVKRSSTLLTVCEGGYGKRSEISEYRLTNRGGKGVINIKTSDRNGPVVAIKEVLDDDELMIISQHGIVIRLPLTNVRVMGRATQGVRLINLDEGDKVIDVARVVASDGAEENGDTEMVNGNGGEPGPVVQ
jgi:DNA gyrase subunit A